LKHGELEDAASRAYYAMFYAARAVLLTKGIKAKTHTGTISMFGEHIIKKGLLNEEFADTFRKAFDLRQKSDYEIFAELDEELVRETINDAKKFIEKIEQFLNPT
jgi:uncharacterized protein (UPF0332 family)